MHMKRTADRLFGKQYKWSVLGAGKNQLAIAAQAKRNRGQPLDKLQGAAIASQLKAGATALSKRFDGIAEIVRLRRPNSAAVVPARVNAWLARIN